VKTLALMDNQIFKGKWNEIKGDIKRKWSQLTDNDLDATKGNFQSLVGVIQQKLGTSKDDVSQSLREITQRWASDAKETGHGLASNANQAIDDTKDQLKKSG